VKGEGRRDASFARAPQQSHGARWCRRPLTPFCISTSPPPQLTMDAFLGIKPKEPKASAAAEGSSSRTSPAKRKAAGAGASAGGPALEASIPWVER
jgi:hypothetical protein